MSNPFRCGSCGRPFEAGNAGCHACVVLIDPTGEYTPITAADFVAGMEKAMRDVLEMANPDDVAAITGRKP